MLDKLSPVEQQLAISAIIGVAGIICAAFGALAKGMWDRMAKDVQEIKTVQSGCIGKYADKAETKEALKDHEYRLDDHGERITKVEGKVGL